MVRIGVVKDFKAATRPPGAKQSEYLVTITERSLEVADFTYLSVSQESGYLWDFKFKFGCKMSFPGAFHVAFLHGYNKNLVIARGQEQLFFTLSEYFLSNGSSQSPLKTDQQNKPIQAAEIQQDEDT